MNYVNPLNTIKMHTKCHMLKSSDTIYLLTLLANVIVDANHVDQDQQQPILCFHCLTQMFLSISADDKIKIVYCYKHFKE